MTWVETKEGCSLHQILPRTLQHLSREKGSAGSALDGDFERLLESELKGEDECDGLEPGNDEATWQSILCDITAEGLSYAEMNRKRKKLTFEAFQQERIIPVTLAMESLVAPNVKAMYALFGRSATLASIQRLPGSAEKEISELREKCLALPWP